MTDVERPVLDQVDIVVRGHGGDGRLLPAPRSRPNFSFASAEAVDAAYDSLDTAAPVVTAGERPFVTP